MADVRDFQEGGYRYIKAVFQYSGGVAALPGFEIERAGLVCRVVGRLGSCGERPVEKLQPILPPEPLAAR